MTLHDAINKYLKSQQLHWHPAMKMIVDVHQWYLSAYAGFITGFITYIDTIIRNSIIVE